MLVPSHTEIFKGYNHSQLEALQLELTIRQWQYGMWLLFTQLVGHNVSAGWIIWAAMSSMLCTENGRWLTVITHTDIMIASTYPIVSNMFFNLMHLEGGPEEGAT